MSEIDKNLDNIRRDEIEWIRQVAQNVADRTFYERLGRLRQASDTWFTPRLQVDLEILIQMAEKYREHANSITSAERQKPDQS